MPATHLGYQIFLRGAMNPIIHSPEWLQRNHIFDDALLNLALRRKTVIAPPIAQIDMGGYLVVVDQEHWECRTAGTDPNPDHSPVFQGFVRTFSLLKQTPTTALGLNFWGHLPLPEGTGVQDFLRDNLISVPDVVARLGTGDISAKIALIAVQRDGHLLNVRIEPSPLHTNGIVLHTNFHYDLQDEQMDQVERALEIARSSWQTNMDVFSELTAGFESLGVNNNEDE